MPHVDHIRNPKERTRLKRRRKMAGFTQESLADYVGVVRSTIVRWEAARTRHRVCGPSWPRRCGCRSTSWSSCSPSPAGPKAMKITGSAGLVRSWYPPTPKEIP